MEAISIALPQLDQFTRTEWLTYQSGDWTVLPPLILQALAGVIMLAGTALFDLYRKNI